jgi:undecaprenyl-diphosphatase
LPENRDYLIKLGAAFVITAVGGLAAKLVGVELPETVAPVAIALILGGVAILAIEWHLKSVAPSERVTWIVAIVVGLSQVVAGVFPGTSRSAAAIFAAMLVGMTSRPAAAEFAFLVGIPTMIAAAGYQLLSTLREQGSGGENWSSLAIAFVVAAIVAFASVKWLLIYIQAHRFTPFAWYRIVFGALLLAIVS